MAYVPAKLYAGSPGTTAADLYTVPVGSNALVKKIHLSNNTATAATVTLSVGGVALMTALSVDPNTVQVLDMLLVLNAGQIISGLQGTANALTVHITGATYTS